MIEREEMEFTFVDKPLHGFSDFVLDIYSSISSTMNQPQTLWVIIVLLVAIIIAMSAKATWTNDNNRHTCQSHVTEDDSDTESDDAVYGGNIKTFLWREHSVFDVHQIKRDGNCVFRVMAHLTMQNQGRHDFLRDYIVTNWAAFAAHMQIDVNSYKRERSRLSDYGGEAEISAFVRIFEVTIFLYRLDRPEIDPTVFGSSKTHCFVLFSGTLDDGHYDVLKPPENVCPQLTYERNLESLRQRSKTLLRADWELFKAKKRSQTRKRR